MKRIEKKVALYTFLLAAAGIGLLIDRLYAPGIERGTGGPTTSAPYQPSTTTEEEPSCLGPPIAAIFDPSRSSAPSAKGPGLPEPGVVSRDAFDLSPAMREIYQAKSKLIRKEKETARRKKMQEAQETIDAFVKSHRLRGIFIHPTDKWAVVDDRIFRIGDRLDGFELSRIERYRACFSKGSDLVQLKLPGSREAKVGAEKPR